MKSVKTSYTCGLMSQKLYFCVVLWLCPFIHAPLLNRDERSSVSTMETVLDRVSTALHGIQRSMRAQPSEDAIFDMHREIRAVLRNVEGINIWMLGRENYKLCIIMQNFKIMQMSFRQEKLETMQNAERACSSHHNPRFCY